MQDSESLNLNRWRTSGLPEQWVRQRHSQWHHQDWLRLLDDLRSSPYWPMRPDDVGLVLEYFKKKLGRVAPDAAKADAAPLAENLPPTKRTNRGFLKGLSLLALCIAILACVDNYAKRKFQ